MNLIGHQFLKEGMNTLTWVVQHEKSPLVIKAIHDLNLDLTDMRLKSLNEELNKYLANISSTIGITLNEAPFILDLEAIFAHNEEDYELNLNSYKFYKMLRDQKIDEYWLSIKNKHIEALSFNFFNWKYIKQNLNMIASISKLRDPVIYLNLLRRLHLEKHRIPIIPKTIGLLKKLKKLSLSNNNLL